MSFYRKGRLKEWRTIKILRDEGWKVIRSSRSQTPIDIIAAKNGEIKLIQVKSSKISLKEREELSEWKRAFGLDKAEVWIWCKYAKKPKIINV